MSRKSRNFPKWIFFVLIGAVVVMVVGSFLINRSAEPFRTTPPLDLASYAENAASLRGNTYKLSAEVTDMLAWSPTGGRLIAVRVDGESTILPVQVTPAFNAVNIQKEQRFNFLLEVDSKGILKTKSLLQQ